MKKIKLISLFLTVFVTNVKGQNDKISFAPYINLELGVMKNYTNQFVFFGQDDISPNYFLSGGIALYNRLDLGLGIGFDGIAYQQIPSYRFEAGYKFLPQSIISPTINLEIGGNFPSPKNYGMTGGYYVSSKAGISANFKFAPNLNFNLNSGYRNWNLKLDEDFSNEANLKLNSITLNFGITYHFNHPKK